MIITVSYKDGKSYTIDIPDEAFKNAMCCVMDDGTTTITWRDNDESEYPRI